ncbi:hypothetical protein H5410_003618, partial [Solanum commersonii]
MRPFIGYPKPKTEPISDFSKQKKKVETVALNENRTRDMQFSNEPPCHVIFHRGGLGEPPKRHVGPPMVGYTMVSILQHNTSQLARKTLTTTSFQSDLEEQMLTRDAMLNLMKEDYKHINLSSNVGDASIFRLQPYGQQSLLAAKFPDFRLEDKSSFQEGCTDKARIFRTYSRRKKRRQIGEDNDLHLLKFLEVSPKSNEQFLTVIRSHLAIPYGDLVNKETDVAQLNGWIKGFGSQPNAIKGMEISHLLYANDSPIFCEADVVQIKHLRVILTIFEALSDLHVNWQKSFPYLVNDVPNLLSLLGCQKSTKKSHWRFNNEGSALWRNFISQKYGMLNQWNINDVNSPYGSSVVENYQKPMAKLLARLLEK